MNLNFAQLLKVTPINHLLLGLSLEYAKRVKQVKKRVLKALVCSIDMVTLNARNHKTTEA